MINCLFCCWTAASLLFDVIFLSACLFCYILLLTNLKKKTKKKHKKNNVSHSDTDLNLYSYVFFLKRKQTKNPLQRNIHNFQHSNCPSTSVFSFTDLNIVFNWFISHVSIMGGGGSTLSLEREQENSGMGKEKLGLSSRECNLTLVMGWNQGEVG